MKTPITILTGFLGSGKSSLLSQILKDPAFSNSAVIVNEFGEIGLDDFLVTHAEEQVMEMTTGCLCCTIRGDIADTLFELWTKRKTGELPNFDRIIIETTGLADPAPVIQTMMTEPRIFARFGLSGVITTVDATNSLSTMEFQKESVKQIAVADRLVITKTDLEIENTALADLQSQIITLNPTADVMVKNAPDFDLEKLFDTKLFDKTSKTADAQKWLNFEKLPHDHHHHHDHAHDINKHGDHIETFSLIIEDPVPGQSFIAAIQSLVTAHGQNLLRIKGIVNLQDRPHKPYILHGVQHIFHEPFELSNWPTEDKRTKLVFITRHLQREMVEKYFEGWLSNTSS
ncbi:GTP-binding protein [Terasakiella sp. A23]|uniref:CobW family GTP-binding protein n=1 Tax=Terasakiella sp. FCG-A23 TaxID=3080561 RepID=UPI002954FEA7|nr:GTP-binding protein [Terasakiella sp. A23]MDV7340671.1 GTP-binding protein [Terasakiella sp. A23]